MSAGFDLYGGESRFVLCPGLYRRLQLLFGSVEIANQGEAMLAGSIFNHASARWETSVRHSGEYYKVNCPYCNDSRKRLWVNHMYGQRDAGNRRMTWLASCYNEDCLSDSDRWRDFDDKVFGFRNANERHRPLFEVLQGTFEDPTLVPVTMPGEIIPISQLPPQHHAYRYMVEDRRYSRATLDRYEISYCSRANHPYGAAQDRIVFPIKMNGQLVGWQCRYIGKADWRVTPKYYGRPGMKRSLMLYQYDFAKNYPFVIVVEGPTDANTVGDSCVALMGKKLSYHQKSLLLQTWERKPIVFMLDADAREESAVTVRDMINEGTNPIVDVVLPEGYDPNDYGREAIWNLIHATCNQYGVRLAA